MTGRALLRARAWAHQAPDPHRVLEPSWWPLALAAVLSGVLVVAGGIWPMTPTGPHLDQVAVGGALVLLAAVLTVTRTHRLAVPVTYGCALALGSAAIGSGQTVAGVLLMSSGAQYLGLYAAYAFAGRAQAVAICGAVGAVTVGMVLSPVPFRPLSWVVVTVGVALASVIVGRLTYWLRWYASTDELTGAVTRHALWAVAESQLATARRRGEPVTVAVVDLDDFKVINDQQGHAAGDRVLIEVVREWRQRLRAQDVVARTGGDEFVLVLPGSEPAAASRVLRELQAGSVARWSVGLVGARSGETLAQVIARADDELYRAKAARGVTRGPAATGPSTPLPP